MQESVASVMQGASLPLASSVISARPVPKRGRKQKGGREKLPTGSSSALLEADIRSGLCSGCSGGQLAFVSIFVRDCKLSVPCLLVLERKMFLSVFWKQMTPSCSSGRVFVCLVLLTIP